MKTQNILQESESASALKVAFWGLFSELNLVRAVLIYDALYCDRHTTQANHTLAERNLIAIGNKKDFVTRMRSMDKHPINLEIINSTRGRGRKFALQDK